MKGLIACVCLLSGLLWGEEAPVPLLAVGGGYYDGGPRHSGEIYQLEYRNGRCILWRLRLQASLIFPEMRSVFFGIGAGMDFYASKHVVFTPSLTPGLYYKGSGRDLGFPIEFRSCIETAYEWGNKMRLGVQFYHISNGCLSHRNPGANALVLIWAFPFRGCS